MKQKSRTKRRLYSRTPGNRTVMHYVKRRPAKAECTGCGMLLHGVPALRNTDLRKLSKTEKRPERMFGGYFCSSCSRREIISRSRK